MKKPNKLSHTSITMYLNCGLCYKAHYIDNWRPKRLRSSLLFGSALDKALNSLLLEKDLEKAKKIFREEWEKALSQNIEYHKNDLDLELLQHFKLTESISEWVSLGLKGKMFVEAYYEEVLPKFKEIIAVQKPISFKNKDGDEIYGFLDLIVKRPNDKVYLLDNKSSSYKYDVDSAKNSQQLVLYNYIVKNEYNLSGVGFVVLMKKINKNKVKTCKRCGKINTSSHKTCNEKEWIDGGTVGSNSARCNGEFEVTINPTVDIQYIINEVSEEDFNRVLGDCDRANYGISNGIFEKGPEGKYGKCTYHDLHEYGDTTNFIKVERKNDKASPAECSCARQ